MNNARPGYKTLRGDHHASRLDMPCFDAVRAGADAPGARAADYPYQSQPFVLDGVISHVDADRDRVIFSGDDGKTYTLDTSQSEITLLDGNRAGMTPDLSPGMRVHVSGRLLSAGIAEVDQMRVLDDCPAAPCAPDPSCRPARCGQRPAAAADD